MSSISETPIDAVRPVDAQRPKEAQQQQQQNHGQYDQYQNEHEPAIEDVREALQVSEPSSATPSSPHEQRHDDEQEDDCPEEGSHTAPVATAGSPAPPTIQVPESDTSSSVQSGSQQQQAQLSPVPPKSPAPSSRYTIHDDDDDYYEEGFEGGQLTIIQGPGQAAPVPKEAPPFDIRAELDFIKARLETITLDTNDQKANEERIALQELQKSTETYIASQEALTEKQSQLCAVTDNEGVRAVLQSQIEKMAQETKHKERQWSATKEVYHREFGELMDSPRKVSSVRAKTEYDIKQLQDQIAHLQRQLDTVATRRKQMMADAEEHRRRYAEAGLDDE